MNKKILILSVVVLTAVAGLNVSYASDNTNNVQTGNVSTETKDFHKFGHPPFDNPDGPPPHHDFKKPPFDGHGYDHHFDSQRPSKEEMEAKKAEFEKRLKLTDNQKKQIEIQKNKDREKIKPVMDEIHTKKQEFKTIIDDSSLSQAEKDKQLKKVKDDLRELKMKADSMRKDNMNNFESILTEKQKKEFSKIKEEQKKDMEQRKKNFEKQIPNEK